MRASRQMVRIGIAGKLEAMNDEEFCRRIGYTFHRPDLLRQALTHRSHSLPHNERLEFLGDSVLNCAVAGLIFRHFPDLTEGNLSRVRANLVNQQALANLARMLELGIPIRLGEGEPQKRGGPAPFHARRCTGGGARRHLSRWRFRLRRESGCEPFCPPAAKPR